MYKCDYIAVVILLNCHYFAIIIIIWLYSIMHDKLYAKVFTFSKANAFQYSKVVIYRVR